jgi:hypothetical protein
MVEKFDDSAAAAFVDCIRTNNTLRGRIQDSAKMGRLRTFAAGVLSRVSTTFADRKLLESLVNPAQTPVLIAARTPTNKQIAHMTAERRNLNFVPDQRYEWFVGEIERDLLAVLRRFLDVAKPELFDPGSLRSLQVLGNQTRPVRVLHANEDGPGDPPGMVVGHFETVDFLESLAGAIPVARPQSLPGYIVLTEYHVFARIAGRGSKQFRFREIVLEEVQTP